MLVNETDRCHATAVGAAYQVAFVGFAVQALVSRTGPIEGLTKHLSNPGYNITYTLTHLQDVATY